MQYEESSFGTMICDDTSVAIESPFETSYWWKIVTLTLSCIVSKLSRLTGQIFGIDTGCLSSTHPFRVNP